jgi:hypothetical protein
MIMRDMIGFPYPVFVDGEPPVNSVKVTKWDGHNLHLENGQTIAIAPKPSILLRA